MAISLESDDYVSTNPVTFSPETSIFDAIRILVERRLSGGTVLNEQNEVVGVISELDCLKAIIQTGYYRQGGGTVADFMYTGDILYMDDHTTIVDAAQRLVSTGHRRMPIKRDGKFCGQISARSMLQAFMAAMDEKATAAHDLSD
ncbi:CBS domain protein [Alteromonadaceae bacterium 2753L.S.0a.02]|nr:CBS domain protein [Alteromonadaceae bacterium 2753L.S.0a.02]